MEIINLIKFPTFPTYRMKSLSPIQCNFRAAAPTERDEIKNSRRGQLNIDSECMFKEAFSARPDNIQNAYSTIKYVVNVLNEQYIHRYTSSQRILMMHFS